MIWSWLWRHVGGQRWCAEASMIRTLWRHVGGQLMFHVSKSSKASLLRTLIWRYVVIVNFNTCVVRCFSEHVSYVMHDVAIFSRCGNNSVSPSIRDAGGRQLRCPQQNMAATPSVDNKPPLSWVPATRAIKFLHHDASEIIEKFTIIWLDNIFPHHNDDINDCSVQRHTSAMKTWRSFDARPPHVGTC